MITDKQFASLMQVDEQIFNPLEIEKGMLPNLSALSATAHTAINNTTFQQFYRQCDLLRRSSNQHSWTRATVTAIARATIGAGVSFVRHPVYGRNLTPEEIKNIDNTLTDVYNFFYSANPNPEYIQDLATPAGKMFYTMVSFVLYGQVAWEILRDAKGKAIGFDVLPGVVMPNVDNYGKFQTPAYYYQAWNTFEIVSYDNPTDLLFVTWPGTDYFAAGSSEYEALASTVVPSDLYAGIAYKSQFENINAPHNGVWQIDPNTSDDDYRRFLALLVNRYSGANNYGRNPLVIRGSVDFKETKIRRDDAPYLDGRRYNQNEIGAVTGVSGAKLGISDNATRANLREVRRDFHENTLRPLFQMLEDAIYTQIMVREFSHRAYKMVFNRPDLSTALEEATINTRYIQNGVLSPNEVRQSLGKPDRKDALGNTFFHPNNAVYAEEGEDGGAVENGGTNFNKPPSSSSMRQFNVMRPPDEPRIEHSMKTDLIVKELGTWREFAVRVKAGKRNQRNFVPKYIDPEHATLISEFIDKCETKDEIKGIFDAMIQTITEL